MKILFCLALATIGAIPVFSQSSFNDSIAYSRNQTTEKAMVVLGSWAVLNITSGFIIAGQMQGEAKYFWKMNAYWNFINGGLAVMGYLGARKAMAKKFGLADNVAAQESIEKLYAFNFGLDLAYIAGGFFLREKGMNASKPATRDQLQGYGSSIIFQGSFLLLMDGVMIFIHQKNSARLNKRLRSLELGAGSNGLGLTYHF